MSGENDEETRRQLMVLAPIFPKELPNLIPGAVMDELGFTLSEKVALRQAFDQINPFRRNFGKDIFYTYLVDNEDVIEIFRENGDPAEKINLSSLHRHAQTMMRTMHMVVNKGLDDLTSFHMMAHDCAGVHMDHWVPKDHVQLLGSAIKDYVLKVMQKRCSKSLENGFDKVLKKFLGSGDELVSRVRLHKPVDFQSIIEVSPPSIDNM